MEKNDNNHSNNNILKDQNLDIKKNNEEISNLNINNILDNKILTNNNYKKEKTLEYKDEGIYKDLNPQKDGLINQEISKKEKANIEYENLLKNNPDELFNTINEKTIENWKNVLYKKVQIIITEDCNILNSENSKENYKIVSNDIPRTRFREKHLVNSFSSLLDYFISYYCVENNMVYKQGLNEIIAPFLLLKYKLPNIPFHVIYNLFSGYINTFATNYFYEKTFYSLKNSLCLLTLLLKYHAPILQNLFEKIMISPEMYGTNWLLTTFCGKLKLDLLYYLMNKIIIEDDPFIIHYLIIAFIIYKKNIFFESDLTMVPIALTTIYIDSIEEIDKIFNEAIKLRDNTPYSFRIFANMLEIFKCHCDNPNELYEKYKPDKLLTLPIFPCEIFYICFNGITKCPDSNCKNNSKNKNKIENDEENVLNNTKIFQKCEYCDMKIKRDLNYILLDLRIFENEEQDEKEGFLPKIIRIEQKILKNKYFTDSMIQRFNEDKGKSHLIFMTSKTDFFNEFEDNFYIESSQDNNRFNLQFKTDKEINKDLLTKMSLKERIKLKEYDNMKKLLLALLENDFPYISFIYGGFEAIHEQISQYNEDIYLLNHNKNCEICTLKNQNTSWFSTQIKSFLRKSKSFIDGIEIMKDKDKEKKETNKSYIRRISTQINEFQKRNSGKIKDKKYLDTDRISQLINNYENFVKYCNLIKYKDKEFKENDNQGLLVIQKYDLLILKINCNEKGEQIDKIMLTFFEKAELKKKNYVNVDFVDNEKEKFSLYVKFGLEQDAKKFLNEINKAKKLKDK